MSETSIHILILYPGMKPERGIAHLPPRDLKGYFDALRRVVEPVVGEPMEHVNVFTDFHGGTDFCYLDMFVNEMGRLNGLQRNEHATAIYRNNVQVHEVIAPPPEAMPWIAGPAILFEKKVWF